MRVIAGEARGVPLRAPKGTGTRPTSDLLKGAIFSALGDLGCQGRVLDLFAGSGALGIEALSRGAEWCDFVEPAAAACAAIRANLAKTRLEDRAHVVPQPAARFVSGAGREPYDLLLLDPPYAFPELEALLAQLGASPLVSSTSALLLEHAAGRPVPGAVGPLALAKSRQHGDSAFTLYLGLLHLSS